jgi:hypothetical protein
MPIVGLGRKMQTLVDASEGKAYQSVGQPMLPNGGRAADFYGGFSPACSLKFHKFLIAMIGSTFVALRAGILQAARATADSSNVMNKNVNGSVARTP